MDLTVSVLQHLRLVGWGSHLLPSTGFVPDLLCWQLWLCPLVHVLNCIP